MPTDRNIDEEDLAREEIEKDPGTQGRLRRFKEFDCPDCSANNPADDGFGDGDDIVCNYCGSEFQAKVNDDGRLKLKPT